MAKLTGIYCIMNIDSSKMYIGSSNNILKRFKEHRFLLRKSLHHCKYLQRAWDKYGEKTFEFLVIELCSVDDLLTREIFYIKNTKNKYNSSIVTRSGKLASPRTYKQIAAAKINFIKATEASVKSWTGKKHTLDSRKMMSERKNPKYIIIYNKNGEFFGKCKMSSEAEQLTGVKASTIRNNLYGKSKSTRNFTFKYEEVTNG